MEPTTGTLLVATPLLHDGNFARTVVLLCAAGAGGAMGLVLNRPIETLAAADALPAWRGWLAHPATLFRGGPVSPEGAIGIGRAAGSTTPQAWTPVLNDVGLLDLDETPVATALQAARIFVGYAGWGAGQLEGEIEEGAWFVVPALPEDAFSADPGGLWNRVLRRQRGQIATFAHYPVDPRAN